jgi:hypothetical protein
MVTRTSWLYVLSLCGIWIAFGPSIGTPRQAIVGTHWRLGFQGSRDVEFIEVEPHNDSVCFEAMSIRGEAPVGRELYEIPWSRAKTLQSFQQPAVWTLVTLNNQRTVRRLPSLAVLLKSDLNGCFYLVADGASGKGSIESMNDQNLLIAMEGDTNKPVVVHSGREISQEIISKIVREVPAFKAEENTKKVISGRLAEFAPSDPNQTLAVVNYGYPDLSDGGNRWAILRIDNGNIREEFLSPVLPYNPRRMSSAYTVTLVAAADLDGDGQEELLLRKTYYEGDNYVVFSKGALGWVQVYESGVWR